MADTEVIEFGDREGIRRAARLAAQGEVIGIYIDGVDTLWIDGRFPGAAQKIQDIKGEGRVGKPLSAALEAEALVPLLDLERIPGALRPIFGDARQLAGRLGALGPLRLPVTAEAAAGLPPHMVSQTADGTYWLQDFIPAGHAATSLFVYELARAGVTLPAGTSMNVSGTAEIADQEEALAFSREHGLPVLLHDPHPNPYIRGSFPILGVGPEGAALLREGHFPGPLFANLLETEAIDLSEARPAKYPISAQIKEQFEGTELRGQALRQALLAFMHGS